MSALPPEAARKRTSLDVAEVPNPDSCTATNDHAEVRPLERKTLLVSAMEAVGLAMVT